MTRKEQHEQHVLDWIAKLPPDRRTRREELLEEHRRLGEERRRLHAELFAKKLELQAAEERYREILQDRLRVQAELEPLTPPPPPSSKHRA